MEKNMISKNKFLFLFIILISFTFLHAAKSRTTYATKNIIGQNDYLDKCSSCHGDASRGGNVSSIREWKIIFSNNAYELIEIHMYDEENKKILSYLNSNEFKKQSKLILELLQEFAYDSENIPTCN